jgi:hypothetical protein
MAKLTKEERIDSRAGYQNGRKQAERGSPWAIATAEIRSDLYKESHRRGYLAVVARGNFPEPKPKREKKPVPDPMQKEVLAAQKSGYEAGFRQAMEIIKVAQAKTLRGQGEWSSQKISGYQWGYRQAIAGHKSSASGDLRSDPEFDEGYQMGYRAGSRSAQELQTA